MKIKTKELLYVLNKFRGVSEVVSSFDPNFPLWASIIFDSENQRLLYLGRRSSTEVEYPIEKSFIVNYTRLKNLLALCSDEVEIKVNKKTIVLKDNKDRHTLINLEIDYSSFLIREPEELTVITPPPSLIKDIKFCTIAASTNRMDYMKYGVILTDENVMYAITGTNAVAAVFFEEEITPTSILLQLPWCQNLKPLGDIISLAVEDMGKANQILHLELADDLHKFKVVVPVIKIAQNPTLVPYLQSLSADIKIEGITQNILKKLDITTDDAYKFIVAYSDKGDIYFESTSSVKGSVKVKVGEGELDSSVSISLYYLKKMVGLYGYINIDLDNTVAFVKEDNYLYAFNLG